MARDRLHTGRIRNHARIDDVALCQSRKILTEMHARAILLVQVICPARLQSEWIIERAVLRLRRNPHDVQQQDRRMREFHRRSIAFEAGAVVATHGHLVLGRETGGINPLAR